MIIEIPDEDLEDPSKIARALHLVIQSRQSEPSEQLRLELVPRDDGSLALAVGPKAKMETVE
jgi:hypothetical protein